MLVTIGSRIVGVPACCTETQVLRCTELQLYLLFGNVLRAILGAEKDEVKGSGGGCIISLG
jgi:hypothetical protein